VCSRTIFAAGAISSPTHAASTNAEAAPTGGHKCAWSRETAREPAGAVGVGRAIERAVQRHAELFAKRFHSPRVQTLCFASSAHMAALERPNTADGHSTGSEGRMARRSRCKVPDAAAGDLLFPLFRGSAIVRLQMEMMRRGMGHQR